MSMPLTTLTLFEWGSMLAAAWLGYRAFTLDHTQAKKARGFAFAAFAVVALVLIPAVYAVWTIIGEYPIFTCQDCAPITKGAIWSTIFITLALAMAPFVLALHVIRQRIK